ncbi:MAG: hypothetical protein AB1552_06490 [Nitrospirota bacterium]
MSCTILLLALLCLSIPALSADTRVTTVRKQPEIQQIKPKKPVKIKLKRTSDGKYTWDLTGDDVDEIVRADRRLKKQLNIE